MKHVYRFYFIMGSQDVPEEKDPLAVLEAALEAGITCFQLREKGPGAKQGAEKFQFARACQQLCQKYQVPFIVNDNVELALHLKADGVHLGQHDVPVSVWQQKRGNQKVLLGRSTHDIAEIEQAVAEGADYVGLGALYPSETKKDTIHLLDEEKIAAIMHSFPDFPIIGIGGVTVERVEEVFAQGFSGVAIISALAKAESIAATMAEIKAAAKRGEESK